jgi:Myb-like DNA-binding domain
MSVIDNGVAYIGAWSPEEVKELTAIVRSMTSQQGGTTAGISWADVAARMGYKRNGQQCRNKWCDCAALSFIKP